MIKQPILSVIILTGGKGTRMNGKDKGLVEFKGKPLIEHVIEKLKPQVESISISANRNLKTYAQYGYPVLEDSGLGKGPLAGLHTFIQNTNSQFVLCIPCDCPFIDDNLISTLIETQNKTKSLICTAFDGYRIQPIFSLIHTSLKDDLKQFLQSKQKRFTDWILKHNPSLVLFPQQTLININTNKQLRQNETKNTPVFAFSGASGSGKTTLLTFLIKALSKQDYKIAVIKHSHHHFDVDKQGKDSWRFRESGASQVLLASDKRWALMVENKIDEDFSLQQMINNLNKKALDLIFIEGFKGEPTPKIVLHRKASNKAVPTIDQYCQAIVTDDAWLFTKENIPILDLNKPEQVLEFIHTQIP